MLDILETRKDLKERITAQEAQIARLEQELAESAEKLAASDALTQSAIDAKVEKDAELVRTVEQIDAANARIAELEEQAEATEETVKELEEAVVVTEEKVADEAARELAAVGHEPLETISDESSQMTREQFDAEFRRLNEESPLKASRWYVANKHLIGK